MGVEEKAQSSGCGAPPNFLSRHRQPKRYAIRDFPEGCGPSKSFCAAAIKKLNQCEVSVTVSNSKPKLGLLVSSDDDDDKAKTELAKKVRVVEAEALDSAGMINVSKTSDNETTKLSKKAILMQSKPYPPRRRISAIRCFPPGCGTKNLPVNIEVASESTALKKTSGFSHSVPGLEKKQATASHGHRKGALSACDRHKIQLGAKCFKFNKEKQLKNEMDKRLDGRSSGQYRMNQLPKKVPRDLEHPTPRMIVLGLMAPSKFPWKKRKTASIVKLMTDTAKTRAKKH